MKRLWSLPPVQPGIIPPPVVTPAPLRGAGQALSRLSASLWAGSAAKGPQLAMEILYLGGAQHDIPTRYLPRRVLVLGALTLFLAACGRGTAPAPTAAETPPPAPTSAQAPSATPPAALPTVAATPSAPPTASPTPSAAFTPAPNATVTPDPNLGVGEVIYEDKLDGTSGWGWGFADDTVAFSISGGKLNAVMTKPNVGHRFVASPDTVKVGDQQVRVTATTNICYEKDEYGLMFRGRVDAGDNYEVYVFKLNCGGSARVELLLKGKAALPLVDWTASPAIVGGAPAQNTLMVWMAKDQFHFYVNDKYLFSMKDATFAEGFYGFYVRDRTSGGESVSFDHLVARAVKLP